MNSGRITGELRAADGLLGCGRGFDRCYYKTKPSERGLRAETFAAVEGG
jgi:hypothetical protein